MVKYEFDYMEDFMKVIIDKSGKLKGVAYRLLNSKEDNVYLIYLSSNENENIYSYMEHLNIPENTNQEDIKKMFFNRIKEIAEEYQNVYFFAGLIQ